MVSNDLSYNKNSTNLWQFIYLLRQRKKNQIIYHIMNIVRYMFNITIIKLYAMPIINDNEPKIFHYVYGKVVNKLNWTILFIFLTMTIMPTLLTFIGLVQIILKFIDILK